MLALDPPDGGATIGGIVAARRLRAAARPLRRRARPRGGHARGARRRHGRQERRQGDQERGRLRPGQALRRLVRHARRDPRGVGPPAPAARPPPPPPSAARTTPRCSRAAPPRSPTPASSSSASTCAGPAAPARVLVALRRRAPRPAGRGRGAACCARRASTPSCARTTTGSGRPSARASARRLGLSVRVSALQTDLPDAAAQRPSATAPTLVGRAGAGLFLAAPRRAASPGELVAELRGRWTCAVLDRPPGLELAPRRRRSSPAPRALMRRVKERFDPSGACDPGAPSTLGRHPRAAARPDRRLRALRLLPAHLPHLRALGRGDGLAARADRADEAGPRGDLGAARGHISTTASAAWRA